MILNETPVRTSKNYVINNFEIPDEEFNVQVREFTEYQINNIENCKIEDVFNNNLVINNFKPNFNKKVVITKNLNEPLIINFNLNKTNALIENLFIEVANNVNANVVINIASRSKTLHCGNLKLKLCKNSNLNLVVVNYLNEKSTNVFNQECVLLENAKLDFKIIDFGCNNSVYYNNAKLQEENSISSLQTIYLGQANNKFDFNFIQDVYGQKCKSVINCVGALFQESCKNFKGTINFNKGCKKSIGNESEFCMLLSNKAKSKALPMLLCGEEDVSGNHSSSVGKINKKQLFYIMSRGLSKLEATKLIVKANFANILNGLFDENLKKDILNKIDEKIKYE